jgi:hypothetical protein
VPNEYSEVVSTLIIKLNATGDVVRTSSILRQIHGEVVWVTAERNLPLLNLPNRPIQVVAWEDATRLRLQEQTFDLVISLEDDLECCAFASRIRTKQLFGAYLSHGTRVYTDSASEWFDLSLISRLGRTEADRRKLLNRRSYQELIFEGLGLNFSGESYVLPTFDQSTLHGDVAIAPVAGPVWPMKGWAYYDQLKERLERAGLKVNVLPQRNSLLHHLADIAKHTCLVSGDSLPIFNCTSPWEIYPYGLQVKLISPLLNRFFYKRTFDELATTAVKLDDVYNAVLDTFKRTRSPERVSP